MSVLESLYVLVKLETDQLKKGLEDTQSQVKRLESEFENLGRAGDRVSQSFDHVLRSAVGMFAGFASFHAILSGASGAISSIREVGNAARELNVDVSALDAWGSAVERLGGSASGFQSSLGSLAKHFGTTNEIALRALPKLAESFSKLNFTQAQNYGKSLGLDQSTILLLQQGRREVEATIKQQKELGVVTQQQSDNTRKFDAALYDASRAYQQFYRELAAPLLPGITEALEWAVQNKGFVKDAFSAMAVGVGVLSLALIRLNPPLAIAVAALTAISTGYAAVKDDLSAHSEGRQSILGTIEELPLKLSAKVMKFLGYGGKDSNPISRGMIAAFSQAPLTENITAPKAAPIVTVGDVYIQTAATDSAGISKDFKQQVAQAISQADNGVLK